MATTTLRVVTEDGDTLVRCAHEGCTYWVDDLDIDPRCFDHKVEAEGRFGSLDCDGCGDQVPLVTNPRHLVIVLCAACNGGTAIR